MELKIAERAFTVHRSADPLVRGGEKRVGEFQWEAGRIVIDGKLEPGPAWETLVHEVLEVVETLLPPPEDREKRIDWTATVSGMVRASLESCSVDALMALPLETGLLLAEPMLSDVRLRTAKFAHLSPEHFEVAKHLWTKYQLDPWDEGFHVALVPTPQGLQVRLCLHLPTIRAMAHATRRYAGCDAPVFEFGENPYIPERCHYTVYRTLDDGERRPFTVTVSMREAYGPDPEAWAEVVAQKPETCLESRAEVKALRKAFDLPLYLREEFRPTPEGRVDIKSFAARQPLPEAIASQRRAEVPASGDVPQSADGLHAMLAERYGLSPDERRQLIRSVSDGFGDREDGDELRFYAAVLAAAGTWKA